MSGLHELNGIEVRRPYSTVQTGLNVADEPLSYAEVRWAAKYPETAHADAGWFVATDPADLLSSAVAFVTAAHDLVEERQGYSPGRTVTLVRADDGSWTVDGDTVARFGGVR